MHCPICSGRSTGKVGVEQYYCWDCCVEFRIDKEGVRIFDVNEDGSLVSLDPNNDVVL